MLSRRAVPRALAATAAALLIGVAALTAPPPAQAATAHEEAFDADVALVAGQVPVIDAAPSVSRLGGSDRFLTSIAVAQAAFPSDGSVDVVFISSGLAFPDSLTVGPVAAAEAGPVLLTPPDRLPAETAAEISRLAPERIVVVGGPGAVSPALEAQLSDLAPTVERISGADRYETSRAAVAYGYPDGAQRVYVATGRDFPDAVSGGALAAFDGVPLLLIDGLSSSLDEPTRDALAALAPADIVILGGAGVVGEHLAVEAAQLTGAAIERLAGVNRYQTSVQVAARFPASGAVIFATGTTYPDAISAIPLAARSGQAIVLTAPYCIHGDTAAVTRTGLSSVTLVGGVGALRGLVGSLHPCLSTTTSSSLWVMVNKRNPLRNPGYWPSDLRHVNVRNVGGHHLRAEAASAFERLAAASVAAGAGQLGNASAFRSYGSQASLFDSYVRSMGRARAELVSARPGHSEHQTGLAIDVAACSAHGCGGIGSFGSTTQGRWVAANAHRYGFIVRYDAGQTPITGYSHEPWHLRYVGTALAQDYRAGGFRTLEQYFGFPATPTY